jgi:ribose 5-phosphate isomerase
MTCGLCKKPIRGDERYVTDHYKCAVDMDQSFIAERDELLTALKGVVRVADRKTVEFDAARAAIAKAEGKA